MDAKVKKERLFDLSIEVRVPGSAGTWREVTESWGGELGTCMC